VLIERSEKLHALERLFLYHPQGAARIDEVHHKLAVEFQPFHELQANRELLRAAVVSGRATLHIPGQTAARPAQEALQGASALYAALEGWTPASLLGRLTELSGPTLFDVARLAELNELPALAAQAYQRIIQTGEDCAECLYRLAGLAVDASQRRTWLEKAISSAPDHLEARAALGLTTDPCFRHGRDGLSSAGRFQFNCPKPAVQGLEWSTRGAHYSDADGPVAYSGAEAHYKLCLAPDEPVERPQSAQLWIKGRARRKRIGAVPLPAAGLAQVGRGSDLQGMICLPSDVEHGRSDIGLSDGLSLAPVHILPAVLPAQSRLLQKLGRPSVIPGFALDGLEPSEQVEIHFSQAAGQGRACQLFVLSNMSRSHRVEQAAPVLRLRVRAPDGSGTVYEMLAGVHTADSWWERPATSPRHRRPRVFSSWSTGQGFDAHVYEATFTLPEAGIEGMEITCLGEATVNLLLVAAICDPS
jgi:hypothetical protein